MSSLVLLFLFAFPAEEADEVDPVSRACELFASEPLEIQSAIIRDIRERLEKSDNAGMAEFRRLGRKAMKELKVKPWNGPEFFEHSVYAPVQVPRSYVDVESEDARYQYNLMRPWENATSYYCRIRYDYARDHAWDLGTPLTPEQELYNLVYGYPPDCDLLIAWLEMKFDHNDDLDPIADYFGHAYCDRVGNCYSEITIYDAFASQSAVEMSDIDVIAYARNVLDDHSFVSPIPGNSRRQRLYNKIRDGFLLHYRNRTLNEAAANVYVNPETWLRPEHDGLRERLYMVFAMSRGNLERVRSRLVNCENRDQFIDAMDKLGEESQRKIDDGYAWAAEQNKIRWVIAGAAYDALREQGLLYD